MAWYLDITCLFSLVGKLKALVGISLTLIPTMVTASLVTARSTPPSFQFVVTESADHKVKRPLDPPDQLWLPVIVPS